MALFNYVHSDQMCETSFYFFPQEQDTTTINPSGKRPDPATPVAEAAMASVSGACLFLWSQWLFQH